MIVLLELVEGLTAFNTPGDLLGDLLDISAKLRQHGLSFLDRSVSRDDAVELQRLESLQGGGPLVGKAIPHVREQAVHQVAGRDHALRGDEGDDIARRVGATQEEQMDLPAAAVDDEPPLEGHRRQGHARRRHLLPIFLEPLDVCPEDGALGLVLARFQLAAKVGDLLRHVVERLLQPRHAELLQPLPRLDRRDHLDPGAEHLGVGFVAHGMVAVEVAVDHIPNGELGDLVPDLPDQGFRGRRFRVGVDDQDVVAIDDDRRVAVQHGGRLGDRAVDAVRDLLEVEERGRDPGPPGVG